MCWKLIGLTTVVSPCSLFASYCLPYMSPEAGPIRRKDGTIDPCDPDLARPCMPTLYYSICFFISFFRFFCFLIFGLRNITQTQVYNVTWCTFPIHKNFFNSIHAEKNFGAETGGGQKFERLKIRTVETAKLVQYTEKKSFESNENLFCRP